MTWTLVCEYAGRTFRPPLIAVPRIAERASFWRADSASLEVDVDFIDVVGIARLVSQGYLPHSGTARLYRDAEETQLVVQGAWQSVEYGAINTAATIRIGESVADDLAVVPASGDFLRRLNQDEATEAKETAYADAAEHGEVSPILALISASIYVNVSRIAEGRVGPMVFGAPGTASRPGSPALFSDTVTDGGQWIVAMHPVAASTVTLWGPGPEGGLVSQAGIAVYTVRDNAGRDVSIVKASDLTGTQNSTGPDDELILGSGIQIDGEAEYYVSWTGGVALPGGAGDVLLTLLSLSTLRVDWPAWQAVRDRLNVYGLAGYADDEVSPASLALEVIGSNLPIGSEHGPDGIRPTVWPFLDDQQGEAIGITLAVADRDPDTGTYPPGTSCVLDGGVRYTGSTVSTATTISYAYDPSTTTYSRAVLVDERSSGHAAVAATLSARRSAPAKRDTRWVASEAVATALALERLRADSVPRRVVRLLCDASVYGWGAPLHLRAGMGVRLSVPSLHIADELAHVSEIAWADPMMTVTVELADGPLRARGS